MSTPTLEQLSATVAASGTLSVTAFYFWSVALMILIHAGFLAYEMGASRTKNVLASAVKNILAFTLIVPTMFYFGWWIYLALPSGIIPDPGGAAGLPWNAHMGPNLADPYNGVFWAVFVLFSATTASILSGAAIERIKISAFAILAIVLGSGVWMLAAAWGWSPTGWMLTKLGFHDAGAAGVVHEIAGFFTLGVLMQLGPRVGKYGPDGKPKELRPHNVPLTVIGLMLIIAGFFGFMAGCVIYNADGSMTDIYSNPTNLAAWLFNILMGFAGGALGSYLVAREPFWMMSGGLLGIIAIASGVNLYYPGLAYLIAMGAGLMGPIIGRYIERKGIDDPVGAITVHGLGGLYSVVAVGVFSAGYPNVSGPPISLSGQLIGAGVLAVLGFVPGYAISAVMKKMGALRVGSSVEVKGLDPVEVPAVAYDTQG
ncbi:MAG: ammonium transporter [Gammaproteobacteria bacterium]|jgi:ammonium transporter, Amt family